MEKLIAFLRNNQTVVLIGAFLITLTFLLPRSCRTEKLEREKADLQGQIKIIAQDKLLIEKAYASERKKLEKDISDRDELIATAQGNIDSLNFILNNTEAGIAGLEEKLKDAKTAAERVPILEDLVKGYKVEVFNLKATIVEKDKQIFSLTENYKAEHKLRLDAEAGWDKEKLLTGKLSEELKVSEKIVSRLKIQVAAWKIPTKVTIVAAFIAGVLLIAK